MPIKRKTRNIYPWDKWMQVGSSRTLVQGRDFNCSMRSMLVYLYLTATKRGVKIQVLMKGENAMRIKVSARSKRNAKAG